ncbi:MAG: 5-formyltetrahydrofolate cyclo-ligase [Eubacterium sp.]
MSLKQDLRKELKQKRRKIKNKLSADSVICENLICSDEYLNAQTILFYAALDDEINIDSCINDTLLLGKKVALPACIDSDGNMEFYYIESLKNLKAGSFGVREPDIDKQPCVSDFSSAVCIVPAIAFDKKGYRLGYGKGYYDRFLEKFNSVSIGLCYNELILDELPIGEYDIPVDCIITQNGIYRVRQGG